jgi:glycosyltransferase involved in cell wall biosynthesis
VRLSVVIPTAGGRSSLDRAVKSASGADEVIVIENDASPWGMLSRDEGIAKATGDWILFMDDDDVFAPGVFDCLRPLLADEGWHIFRMQDAAGGRLWRVKEILLGNIGTPMLVVPNRPDLPKWADYANYYGDFEFAKSCQELLGDPHWHEETLALLRPKEPFLSRLRKKVR